LTQIEQLKSTQTFNPPKEYSMQQQLSQEIVKILRLKGKIPAHQ
jgi:hypothetical protein